MGAGAAALKPATFSLAKIEYEKKAAEGLSEADLFSHMQGFISCSSLTPLFVFYCHHSKIFQYHSIIVVCADFILYYLILTIVVKILSSGIVTHAIQLDNFSSISIQSSQYHLRFTQ